MTVITVHRWARRRATEYFLPDVYVLVTLLRRHHAVWRPAANLKHFKYVNLCFISHSIDIFECSDLFRFYYIFKLSEFEV